MLGNEEHWAQVERLEQDRRRANREHEEALRELHAASLGPCAERRRSSWRRYCEAVDLLEQTTLELQQLTLFFERTLEPSTPALQPAFTGRHSSR